MSKANRLPCRGPGPFLSLCYAAVLKDMHTRTETNVTYTPAATILNP